MSTELFTKIENALEYAVAMIKKIIDVIANFKFDVDFTGYETAYDNSTATDGE